MSVIWAKVRFDLWHNKVRTLLAVLSIAAGVFAVGAMFGMSDMLLSSMDKAHQSAAPPHIQMYLTTRIKPDVADSIRKLDGVEEIELFNAVSALYRFRPDAPWKPAVINLKEDYEHQKYQLIQVREGHWPGKDDVGIERLFSQYFKVGLGDSVTFKVGKTERTLPISGVIRHPFVAPPSYGGEPYFLPAPRDWNTLACRKANTAGCLLASSPTAPNTPKRLRPPSRITSPNKTLA
jgi:putative ABC transport system permease protein